VARATQRDLVSLQRAACFFFFGLLCVSTALSRGGGGSAARMWFVTAAMGSAVKVALSRTAAKRAASVAQVRMRLFTVTALAEAAKKAVEAVLVGTWARASLCGGQREGRRHGACEESTGAASRALSHQCREVLQRFSLLDWSLALADATRAAHSQSGGADT